MTKAHSENLARVSHEQHWPTAVAALAVGTMFFSLWFWLLPQWLGFRVEMAGTAHWRWLAALPSVLGFAVALRCVWDFGWTGHGTPAPAAPPKRLVIVGFYRYVRNPMYLGFAVGWIGLWVVFGHANRLAIAAVVSVALGVHLFVVLYEEPTLRRKFGVDYEAYCRNVSRWWPRLKGWTNRNRDVNRDSKASRSRRSAADGSPEHMPAREHPRATRLQMVAWSPSRKRNRCSQAFDADDSSIAPAAT